MTNLNINLPYHSLYFSFNFHFFIFVIVFTLASCAEISSLTNPGSSTSVSEVSEANEPTQEDVLNQFSDVAFPPETYLDLTKSVVVGSDENWFGQIYFNSGLDANSVFNYFKEHMPDTGWFLIMEQQGNQIFLVYEKDLRTAIISISRKRSGADTILAVAPRAQ